MNQNMQSVDARRNMKKPSRALYEKTPKMLPYCVSPPSFDVFKLSPPLLNHLKSNFEV